MRKIEEMSEETAIETLHHGATDYVLKQRLSRLGPAAGGSSTTIIFPTTPDMGSRILIDDYYNGMKVYCGGEIRDIL